MSTREALLRQHDRAVRLSVSLRVQRVIVSALAVLALFTLVMVWLRSPALVRFESLTAGELVQLLAPVVLLSLFIERTLEVFLTPYRNPGAVGLETQARAALSGAKSGEPAALAGAADALAALKAYKVGTRRIAFAASLALGLLVAAAGMRVLEQLADPATMGALGSFQKALFETLDVFITGGLLAGGSDGLHKIVATFTDFVERTRPEESRA
jgi:hypothetical protein